MSVRSEAAAKIWQRDLYSGAAQTRRASSLRRVFDCTGTPIRETDQKQTRSSTPGQAKRMTNVLRKIIAIAILAINGKGSVGDCVP